MTKQQKRQCWRSVGLALVLGALPTFVYLCFDKKLLPVWYSKEQKTQLLVSQLPFTTIVAPNNSMTTRSATKLSEEQKIGLATGLAMVFNAHADNLAHYFPYFTMVQFGSSENIWALAIVFSSNLPQVSANAGTRTVSWKGQYIGFDLTRRRMVYAVDGVFQFNGADVLEVSVHGSAFFLELGAIGQPIDPRRIVPTEPSERF